MVAKRFGYWAGLVVLAPLGACAVGPNYRPATAPELGVPSAFVAPSGAVPRDLSRWWTVFDDPVLTALIDQATADNLSIAQSAERLVQAR